MPTEASPQYIDPEWKALDFQQEVRPAQLQKLQIQHGQIAQIGQQLQANNDKNLAQIDASYAETDILEKEFIEKKMENMNLVNESEMEGIKFLQNFGECTRESESINANINQIQYVIAMLQNELSQADCDEENMNTVYSQEQQLLLQRQLVAKECDEKVLADIKDQCRQTETDISEIEKMQTKQTFIHEGLTAKQQQVLDDLEKQCQIFEDERMTLQAEKEDLQTNVRQAKKENDEKINKNRMLDSQIRQMNVKIESTEGYLDSLVFENIEQYDQYQDAVAENNVNIDKLREDLGNVQKKHFEMENINESLEQRIDQVKGQRDLSIKITRAGLDKELIAMKTDAKRTSQKLINLLNNTELSWEDKLIVKMRELDDAMRQSSEESINKQVQQYMQQIREMNKDIVQVTQEKEEIESKMLQEVNDAELQNLQSEHSALIKDYEEIIKEKIDIFTQMINNLKKISDGNIQYIQNEETIAEKKLSIEVWDRDIYQKKRVDMDVQVETQNMLTYIEMEERKIKERDLRINELNEEYEGAKLEYQEFQVDFETRDGRIVELENQLANIDADRARIQAEEDERRRLEEEARRNKPVIKSRYNFIKGDKVDEKMAVYINNFDMDVPIQRLGDGQYMFGSRKIFAKIMNDKLVIRVGGGYMLIDEFLPTYGQQELDKINAQAMRSNPSSFAAGSGSLTRAIGGRGSPMNQWEKSGPDGRDSPTAKKTMDF